MYEDEDEEGDKEDEEQEGGSEVAKDPEFVDVEAEEDADAGDEGDVEEVTVCYVPTRPMAPITDYNFTDFNWLNGILCMD